MKYFYFLLYIFIVVCHAREENKEKEKRYTEHWVDIGSLAMVWSLIPGDLGRFQELGDLLYDMDLIASPVIAALSVFIIVATMTVCFTILTFQAIYSKLTLWYQTRFSEYSLEDNLFIEE